MYYTLFPLRVIPLLIVQTQDALTCMEIFFQKFWKTSQHYFP